MSLTEMRREDMPAMPDDGRDSFLMAATHLYAGALIDLDYLAECLGDQAVTPGDYWSVDAVLESPSSGLTVLCLTRGEEYGGIAVPPTTLVRVIEP